MKKKLNKLTFNKEVLIRLQESQMKTLLGGGQEAISNGATSSYTCGQVCLPIGTSETYITCPGNPPIPDSCCRKTCIATDNVRQVSPYHGS